jgi:hypothetical protein
MRKFLVLMAAIGVIAGCEHQNHSVTMSAPPKPLRLARPEAAYRLLPEDRARVQRGFDVDALERLLQHVRPDMRQEILAHFQVHDAPNRNYGQLVQFHDPQLQAILEEIWAPMWNEVNATDQQIQENAYGFPGRDIARRRRAVGQSRQ